MTRSWIPVTLLLLPLPAAAQETLAWKFAKGDVFYIERISNQKSSVETLQKIHQQESDIVWTFRVEAVKDNQLEAATESFVHKVKGAGTPIDNKLGERMKGTKFLVKLTPAGKIEEWGDYAEFVDKVGGKDEQLKKAIQSLYPKEGLHEMFAEMFSFLPEQPVKVGDSWERKTNEALPPFGSLAQTIRYTLREAKDGKARIDSDIQSKYQMPEKQDELFRVAEGTIQVTEARQTYHFDVQQGRLVHFDKTMRLQGNLTLEIQSKKLANGLRSENTLKVKFFTK